MNVYFVRKIRPNSSIYDIMKKKPAFSIPKTIASIYVFKMRNTNDNSNINLFLVRLSNKNKKNEIFQITNFVKKKTTFFQFSHSDGFFA